ncbi:hypothetical protein [Candidatus Amarolinea aalborgensis]|uniref:hypothetical protein n=1 Tax=Candidatus Amarolinea aalborgensis TaxID=2249329 RepID=UPI003BFA33C7
MPSDMADVQDVQEANDTIQEAADATKPLSLAGIKAMQGGDVTGQPGLPADSQPAVATTELGADVRAETGPEKPEVKLYHNTLEVNKETRPAGTPEGWQPGGPERG